MERECKWYISLGGCLWDDKYVDLLTILKSKAKYMLCGFDINDQNKAMFLEKHLNVSPVFFHDKSVPFIIEMYQHWKQPTSQFCFEWYLSHEAPAELISMSDNYLFTDDLTDIKSMIISVSIVEYNDFAICVKDYRGVFKSILNELSDLFEGENQFTEYKKGLTRFI